jgi:hypothetical protein
MLSGMLYHVVLVRTDVSEERQFLKKATWRNISEEGIFVFKYVNVIGSFLDVGG